MRTFISVKFPLRILEKIKDIQESLPEFSGKKTELKNIHLTLKFLGDIPCSKLLEVKQRLNNIKFNKFEVDINDIGFFEKKDGKSILWLGIKNCESIQKEVDNCLEGIFEKEKRFMGHITIARINDISDKRKFIEELSKLKVVKMFFTVDKFYLMRSKLRKEGPEYFTLEEYDLN